MPSILNSISFYLILGGCVTFARGEEVIPQNYDASRYEPLWKKSPFTLSSVNEEDPAGLGQTLALAAVSKVGSSNLITIYNKNTQQRIHVSEKQPVDGISLVSVQFDNDLKKVKATIKKGEETAVIRYDPLLLAMPSQPSAEGVPAPNVAPPQNQAPAIRPNTQLPRPRTIPRRIVIPSNPPPAPARQQ